jgi:FkbM family methyltransferase
VRRWGAGQAFEPILENFEKLTQKELPNVEYHRVALGNISADLPMTVAGCASSVVPTCNTDSEFETVTVLRGDDLHTRRRPTIVMIDVEGYEPEVIFGLQHSLAEVRAVLYRGALRNFGKERHASGARIHS